MAASDDLNSTTKGQALSLGQLVAWAIAPGRTLSSTASPKATVATSIGTTSVQLVAASTTRRGIEFHHANPNGVNMWVMPQTTAASNQGIFLVPGSRYAIPDSLAANAAFNAIASSGSTNTLTVIEFF